MAIFIVGLKRNSTQIIWSQFLRGHVLDQISIPLERNFKIPSKERVPKQHGVPLHVSSFIVFFHENMIPANYIESCLHTAIQSRYFLNNSNGFQDFHFQLNLYCRLINKCCRDFHNFQNINWRAVNFSKCHVMSTNSMEVKCWSPAFSCPV